MSYISDISIIARFQACQRPVVDLRFFVRQSKFCDVVDDVTHDDVIDVLITMWQLN